MESKLPLETMKEFNYSFRVLFDPREFPISYNEMVGIRNLIKQFLADKLAQREREVAKKIVSVIRNYGEDRYKLTDPNYEFGNKLLEWLDQTYLTTKENK